VEDSGSEDVEQEESMAGTPGGWSAEMDRKLADMRRDPQAYNEKSRAAAREAAKSLVSPRSYLARTQAAKTR
jgi:hypothetical protein